MTDKNNEWATKNEKQTTEDLLTPKANDAYSRQVQLFSVLHALGLEQYTEKLVDKGLDIDKLRELTDKDVDAILATPEIDMKVMQRKKLREAINTIRTGHSKPQHKQQHQQIAPNQITYDATQNPIKGYFGRIYKGEYSRNEVAVKFVHPSSIPGYPNTLEKWLQEVNTLSELRHPNIVLFYGACTAPPVFFIVTEWAERGNLEDVLQDPCVDKSEEQILSFALDAACGLEFLHSRNPPVIHRDLKTANLLVTEKFKVKIADFGLCRYNDDKDQLYKFATPLRPQNVEISAPEELKDRHVSEKGDIYSFALILWELRTGKKRPYEGKDRAWMLQHVVEQQDRLEIAQGTFPEEYEKLVRDCWKHDLKERPSAQDVRDRLEAMLPEIQSTLAKKPGVSPLSSSFPTTTPPYHGSWGQQSQ